MFAIGFGVIATRGTLARSRRSSPTRGGPAPRYRRRRASRSAAGDADVVQKVLARKCSGKRARTRNNRLTPGGVQGRRG
jgi:hypothetical protein